MGRVSYGKQADHSVNLRLKNRGSNRGPTTCQPLHFERNISLFTISIMRSRRPFPLALARAEIASISEPTIKATLHIPSTSIGDILALVTEKRGYVDHAESIDGTRVMMTAHLPLNEILVDFNDRLKSITKGYGSMDYELSVYQESKLLRLDILVNGEPVDAFSSITHVDKAEGRGRQLCEKLKEILPRQLFKVAIQASVGAKVIARSTVSALRKDVTAKCYGGDISRKRKLLDKQKEGKKRMKQVGKVSIPQEAFVDILKSTNR